MGAPGEEQYYAEQERREQERVKREVAREGEERENRAREEARERAREQKDEEHRVGERNLARVHAPEGYGFSAGGGPSFLLNITEGLNIPAEAAKVENVKAGYASVVYNPGLISIMKDKSVAPGSVWEILGIYMKLTPAILANIGGPEAQNPGNSTTLMAVTATMYRNTHPIWIASASVSPHVQLPEKYEVVVGWRLSASGQALTLGAEFTSPIIIGPGEQLSLELSYEGQLAWENKATSFGVFFYYTPVPGIGSLRYNVRSTGKG